MSTEQKLKDVSRQRPVSCRFCRTRKLRCSRTIPCSNCVSRNLQCDLEPPPVHTSEGQDRTNSELLERIRKLEQIVESQKSQTAGSHRASSVEAIHPQNAAISEQIKGLDKDVAWLEKIYTCDEISQGSLSVRKTVIRVCPIQHVLKTRAYVFPDSDFQTTNAEPLRCFWLPQYSEAQVLLQKYIEDIDLNHHLMHTPSLPMVLNDVYAGLNDQSGFQPGKVLLLLAIFATSTLSWRCHDCDRGVFSSAAEANDQASFWVKATEDVLDNAYRVKPISVEGIIGIIIMSFVLGNMEGFSRRVRSFYSTAILLARELGLHRIDHPSNFAQSKTAQAEIGRRVWWYLAASDWLVAARMDGVYQGVYQIHLRQMAVRKPLNIDDEDVADGKELVEQPASRPTAMSYFLMRLRLAEISRNIIDRSPLMKLDTISLDHDLVLDSDTELQMLLNDIPSFFCMQITDIAKTYNFEMPRASDFFYQGYMFRSFVYGLRCKLHFPYFSRGYVDSRYTSSRQLCLQAARQLILNEVGLENAGLGHVARYRNLGLLLGTFTATMVLFMDLCHKNASTDQQDERREFDQALQILDEARHESETAARLLDSLMQILRKHKVSPPNRARLPRTVEHQANSTHETAMGNISPPQPMTPSSMISGAEMDIHMNGAEPDYGNDLSSYFNEVTQGFEQGVDLGTFDWDNLFADLGSSLN